MEYLIVFSVAAMMIAYTWIIGRCLRNNNRAKHGAHAEFVSGRLLCPEFER